MAEFKTAFDFRSILAHPIVLDVSEMKLTNAKTYGELLKLDLLTSSSENEVDQRKDVEANDSKGDRDGPKRE